MSQTLTIVGNLADDPELRFTAQGKAVATIRVLTSRSRKNEAGQWETEGTTGWHISMWDRLAENVAESLQKGDAVIVQGRAEWRSWEKDDGTKGGRLEVTAWNVGADLKRAPARIDRIDRDNVKGSQQTSPQADPWAATEPPF